MNENKYNKFFRDKLLKYSSVIPEDMWQRIHQKNNRDRKIFFFILTCAVSFLIFLIAGYFILYTNKKNIYDQQPIASATNKSIGIKNNFDKIKNPGNNESININHNTTDIKKIKNRIVPDKQFDNNKIYFYSNKQQNKKSKADPFNDVTNIHSNPASDSSTNIYHANENIIKKSFDSIGDNQAIILNPLPKDSLSKNNLTLLQNPSKKESELPQIKNKNWFFDVYISPDLPFTKITSGNANFLQLIKESNKMQMSYTIGAKISRSFAKYFIAELGFQYSQINAKFHDSISIINRYRSIDIPLLIGYAIKNSRFKTTINTTINAGLIFNLYSWYKGLILDTLGVVDINAANIYKQNSGISLYMGISFSKLLNNKLQIFTEPYFRYRLSYMTKPQAPFNQKINVAGLSFGLKYNFQKKMQHK